MSYFLGVDIGSVNAKLARIDGNGRVVSCVAGMGRLPEQQAYRIGVSMEDFASLALKCRGTPLQEISYGSLGV